MNRYFISGMHVVHRLVARGSSFTKDLAPALLRCLEELTCRIEEELDCPHAYQPVKSVEKGVKVSKEKLIRRIYQILRKKQRGETREALQKKTLELCSQINTNSDPQFFLQSVCMF